MCCMRGGEKDDEEKARGWMENEDDGDSEADDKLELVNINRRDLPVRDTLFL